MVASILHPGRVQRRRADRVLAVTARGDHGLRAIGWTRDQLEHFRLERRGVTITAAVSIAGLLDPSLTTLLTRDPALVRDGQWWRLITPVFVQPDGWGQFAFNLAGIGLVGVAAERRRTPWLTAYLLAGLASNVLLALFRPGDHGGGSSDCVAGLIGALALALAWTDSRGPGAPAGRIDAAAIAYGAFFCVYLTLLDRAGVWPASIAGDLAIAIVLTARRWLGERRTAYGLLALVVVCGIVLAAQLDSHGIGLLVGLTVAGVAGRRAAHPKDGITDDC